MCHFENRKELQAEYVMRDSDSPVFCYLCQCVPAIGTTIGLLSVWVYIWKYGYHISRFQIHKNEFGGLGPRHSH
jgi:hypothetical protein